jgi:hypothetical protein
MILENKICLLINWPREIDMYNELINSIPEEKIDIIINDLKTFEKERKGNALDIKENLLSRNKKFKYFSEIYHKKKYKIILSTGLAHQLKISLYSVLKFLYGRTIGHLMDILGISKIFFKIFNRPFNAGGKYSRIGSYAWYPEKMLAEKSIRYPTGMDLNLKIYPEKDLERNFDIFFTHSAMETNLIKKKFNNKICKIIGYPRYSKLNDKKKIMNNLKNEFNLDVTKKIIFWTPTHIHYPNETSKNFIPWINKVSELSREYNIIVRPHPKLITLNSSIKTDLTKKNFFVDNKSDRKIGDLFKVADLVFCDYGGTLFSSIYLEKPLLLLNMDDNTQFIKELKINLSLDLKLRNDLINFNIGVNTKEFKNKISYALDSSYNKKILHLKKLYFGDEKETLSSDKIVRFLLNKLSN